MKTPSVVIRLTRTLLVLSAATALCAAASLFSRAAAQGGAASGYVISPQTQCTFSNGSTITFGRKAAGLTENGPDVWQAGDYDATTFSATATVLTDLVHPGIPAGRYTMFFNPNNKPLVLIISKKDGWGISYPGRDYDIERAPVAVDGWMHAASDLKSIGCEQRPKTPTFLLIAIDGHTAYGKIMVDTTRNGQTSFVWN